MILQQQIQAHGKQALIQWQSLPSTRMEQLMIEN